jgi:hypothetical protein
MLVLAVRSSCVFLAVWIASLAPAEAIVVDASAARNGLAAAAFGESVALAGVADVVSGERFDLELRRFEVAAPDARLHLRGIAGTEIRALPANRYFGGTIAGLPGSRAFVALHEDGTLRGLAAHAGQFILFGQASEQSLGAGRLDANRLQASELATRDKPFDCQQQHIQPARSLDLLTPEAFAEFVAASEVVPETPARTARYAVEADFEFFSLAPFGGNSTTATNYILDLMAFISMLYDDETSTTIQVGDIFLQTVAGDPWNETEVLCRFYDFGRYWNDNRGAVSRDAAVMFSGRTTGAGIAWLGVLCSTAFNTNIGVVACPGLTPANDNYGGHYAYVSGIDGDFDIWNPLVIWDLVATAHEIGHNFNSQHTHCYAGEAANANHIDICYSLQCPLPTVGPNCLAATNPCSGSGSAATYSNGCFCPQGSQALPGVGTATGGSAGQGGGTIMSYCHLLGGGFGNTSLNFGTGHTYGIAASREAAKMTTYAAGRACLAYSPGSAIFVDGFETGNSNRWNSDQP